LNIFDHEPVDTLGARGCSEGARVVVEISKVDIAE